MPRPTARSTSIEIIRVLKGLPSWQTRHAEALAEELDDRPVGEVTPDALAEQLDAAEALLSKERKDDKNVTTQIEAFLKAHQSWATSLDAQLLRRLASHPDQGRIMSDFRTNNPSEVDSLEDARRALSAITSALQVHGATLEKLTGKVPAWTQRAADLQTQRAALAELASKEAQETSAAQRDRDALRTQALDTIRDMDLAAKALEDDLAPRIELRALFDAR